MGAYGLFFLVALAIGGVAWVFVYPYLSGEKKAERRVASVARAEPIARPTRAPGKSRREQVEGTLKDIEERRKKASRPPLSVRIAQAGLDWSKRRFMITAGALGFGGFAIMMIVHGGLIPALGVGFAAGCGLPFWALSFLKKRRESKFLAMFPDAVDVIVRGIKAGLPLLDSLKLIAQDAEEPVRSEFRAIIETQTIGMPIGEACSEALRQHFGPGSQLLRHRHLHPAARRRQPLGGAGQSVASAARPQEDEGQNQVDVAGSQGVRLDHRRPADRGMTLVWLTSPDYIDLLFTDPFGHVMLACSAAWMLCGVLVMRKMINFDF